jgi:hypothetical protein
MRSHTLPVLKLLSDSVHKEKTLLNLMSVKVLLTSVDVSVYTQCSQKLGN